MTAPQAALRVSIAQLNSQDDVGANLGVMVELVRQARAEGSVVVAFPEGCTTLGDVGKKRLAAEPSPQVGLAPVEGGAICALSKLAAECQLYIVAGGLPIRSGDDVRPHNALIVFANNGVVIANYKKLHLFDVDLADGTRLRESDSCLAGEPADEIATVDIEGWRLGLSICYDMRFPELYRKLTDRGAHAMLVPSAFAVHTGKDHWSVLLRARAIESQAYVIAPAQWGNHPGKRQTYGKSLIADPWGDVIALASDGVGLAHATLDPKRLAAVRTQLPALRHRRLR